MTVPVAILSSVDPVLRETALFAALSDLPDTAVLIQDLDPEAGTLRRVVSDQTGVVDLRTAELEHTCLGCAIREDSLPSLGAMVASGRWRRIIWALPVGAETAPAARPLADQSTASSLGVTLAGVLALVDTETAQADLLGDDLLDDRGLALALGDRRSVGEVLSGQLRHADLVLTTGENVLGAALVDHLRGRGSRCVDLFEASGQTLMARRYAHPRSEARIDPRLAGLPDATSDAGVWSWTLQSRQPVHPQRFLRRLGDLVGTNLLSHGCFHLPGRPGQVGEWDGSGGQLSLGDGGGWEMVPAVTRLRFVGTGQRPEHLREAFADMLITDDERTTADRWLDVDDGLDAWLGRRPTT